MRMRLKIFVNDFANSQTRFTKVGDSEPRSVQKLVIMSYKLPGRFPKRLCLPKTPSDLLTLWVTGVILVVTMLHGRFREATRAEKTYLDVVDSLATPRS
jgi:hypothetical protein